MCVINAEDRQRGEVARWDNYGEIAVGAEQAGLGGATVAAGVTSVEEPPVENK